MPTPVPCFHRQDLLFRDVQNCCAVHPVNRNTMNMLAESFSLEQVSVDSYVFTTRSVGDPLNRPDYDGTYIMSLSLAAIYEL